MYFKFCMIVPFYTYSNMPNKRGGPNKRGDGKNQQKQ